MESREGERDLNVTIDGHNSKQTPDAESFTERLLILCPIIPNLYYCLNLHGAAKS